MSEKETFTKESWVAMFEEIGLDQQTMHRWHVIFERRWPAQHDSFLQWLGVSADEARRIREGCRDDGASPA